MAPIKHGLGGSVRLAYCFFGQLPVCRQESLIMIC